MRRRRVRDDGGASAVEFALVLPFLVLVLFGMITTGLTYSDHLGITNAVREGARFGAATDYSAATWGTSVRSRVKQVYFNGGDLSDDYDKYICVDLVDSDGDSQASSILAGNKCGTEPGSPDDMAPGSCVVKVWMSKPAKIELIVAPDLNFNLGAESVSYYGRTVDSCSAD
jgi:Flp pilus assembly pilin Flp